MARLLIFARVDPAVGTPSCPDGAVDVELPIMASAGDIIADLQTRGLVREKALAGVRPMGGELLRTGETLADAGVCAQSTVHVVLRLTAKERQALNIKLVNAVAKKQGDAVQTLLEAGADANSQYNDCISTLHLALELGYVGMARLIAERGGIDVDGQDE
eukprot:Hpha_TRINITY_DN16503_c3_g1::TRINITY_DN16503_c3_g1_i1::g.132348::m.132348